MEIGDFVRCERRRQGLNQEELANHSKIDQDVLRQLEADAGTVPLQSINNVLRALGYQIGIIRDFRPWDPDFHPSSLEVAPELEHLRIGF